MTNNLTNISFDKIKEPSIVYVQGSESPSPSKVALVITQNGKYAGKAHSQITIEGFSTLALDFQPYNTKKRSETA